MAETSVKVDNVYMMFNLSKNKESRLKEYVIDMIKGNLFFDEFWALENVSFELKRGESMGLVGVNGSGKSTLLRLVAGIMQPTHGTVYTKGSIAPLIAHGGGFEPALSARENIYLNGAMHGHSTEFMKKRFDDIISFAGLRNLLMFLSRIFLPVCCQDLAFLLLPRFMQI